MHPHEVEYLESLEAECRVLFLLKEDPQGLVTALGEPQDVQEIAFDPGAYVIMQELFEETAELCLGEQAQDLELVLVAAEFLRLEETTDEDGQVEGAVFEGSFNGEGRKALVKKIGILVLEPPEPGNLLFQTDRSGAMKRCRNESGIGSLRDLQDQFERFSGTQTGKGQEDLSAVEWGKVRIECDELAAAKAATHVTQAAQAQGQSWSLG